MPTRSFGHFTARVAASVLAFVLIPGCDRGGEDLTVRFAAITPTCGAAEPYTPPPPLQIGLAKIPLSDADIRDTVTCVGPEARLVLRRDERGTTRALELVMTAETSAAVRPRIEAVLAGLVSVDAVRHISEDLESFLADRVPFGEVSAASYHRPAIGPPPHEYVVEIRWR